MMFRLPLMVTAALTLWAGSAHAADAQRGSAGAEGRAVAIAAQMSKGLSYDQASRAAREASDVESRADTSRLDTYAKLMSQGASYDQATAAAREQTPRDVNVANARWVKHLAVMSSGATSHEAGWAASNEK